MRYPMTLTLSLSVDETQIVLNILAEAPYKVSEPLITKIRSQAQAQIAAAEKASDEAT
jgi:hypothetical protein